MEFGDLRSAARMRDLIERIAGKVVDKKRPDVRIGYVNNYDSGRQLAWVKFHGDDELVKVRIALNMLPTRTIQSNGQGEADIVRVAGKPGSYYVIDFVRGVPQNPDSIPIVDVNFNQQKGINAGDATNPQDVLNLRTADARFATIAVVNSKEPALPAGGNTGHFLRGDKTWQTLNKADVGLSNVDNTSDAAKPVSTAQATAIGLKQDAATAVTTNTAQTITGKKTLASPLAFDQQTGIPTPPPAGDNQIYFKNDGLPYFMGADGVERAFRDVPIALHSNPGFDVWSGGKPADWSSYWRDSASIPATWTQDFVDKIGGVSSMRIQVAAGGNGRVQTTVFPVTPGQIVTFDIWAKAVAPLNGATLSLGLLTKLNGDPNFFDSSVIMQSQSLTLTTSWKKFTVNWRIPADHNNARIDVNPYTFTSGAAIDVYIDESFTAVQTTSGATGVEPGSINLWPFDTPPAGYLMCDGSVKNIADYPVLAALCGVSFGGDGTTTFGLPDLRGRLPLGASTLNAIRSNEGVVESSRNLSHTHTIAHSHTINHSHSDSFSLNKTTEAKPTGSGGGQVLMQATSLAGGVTAYSGSSGGASTGSSGAQPNTGVNSIPFLAVNFIIKT